MSTKNNPSKYDCYSKAEPDEPMFVLLARDPDAPMLVELWVTLKNARNNNAFSDKTLEASAVATKMRRWRGDKSA